jgi:hypothetical protein
MFDMSSGDPRRARLEVGQVVAWREADHRAMDASRGESVRCGTLRTASIVH